MKKILGILSICCICFSACETPLPSDRYKSFIFKSWQVQKHPDIIYGHNIPFNQNQVQDLEMNVFEPDQEHDELEKRPLVILAQGGHFINLNRASYNNKCKALARIGFVAATIDYRLYEGPTPIDSVTQAEIVFRGVADMKAAIRFFRHDAATDNKYKIDPDKIIVGGFSAGATMSLLTAYADADDPLPTYIQEVIANNGGIEGNTFVENIGAIGNDLYSSEVLLAINIAGNIHSVDIIDADDPPLFSQHAVNDPIAPFNSGIVKRGGNQISNVKVVGAELIHDRLEALGIDNQLHVLNNNKHTGITDTASKKLGKFIYDYVAED